MGAAYATQTLAAPYTTRGDNAARQTWDSGPAMYCRSDALAARWATFLVSRYADNAAIQREYGVSERTVRLWLAQDVEPRARHFRHACRRHPDAIAFLVGVE